MSEPDLSPPAPASAAGATTRRPWWRRRLTMGVAASAVVLVLGVVLLAWPGGSDKPKLLVPPGRPDPVPTGPLITKVAKDCGVSADTVHRLTPGSRMSTDSTLPGHCSWYWSDPRCPGWCSREPGDQDRSIRVELDRREKPADALSAFGGQESPDQSDLRSDARRSRPKTLTGLGDEAVAYYAPGDELGGTLVVFRAANVVASVKYSGVNSTRQDLTKPISEKTATDGALRVATDVAKGLGAAAHPTTVTSAAPATTPSIQRYPELCDTVPARLRDALAPKATPSMQDASSLGLMSGIHGGSSVACMWQSFSGGVSRYLRVTVASASDWRPGAGMSEATREYLRLHYTERAAGRDFKPLAGLGEQAFSVYRLNQAAVVFRVRNALVEVDFYGDAMSADKAIKGAYTAATYVARALHG